MNLLYILLSLFVFKRSIYRYVILSLPAFIIEFWFERIARPVYQDGDLKRAGEDLEAKGLTDWMWDVVYSTWGITVVAAFAGNWAWWLMILPAGYSLWLAYTTYTGVRGGMGGMMGNGQDAGAQSGGQSKRQAKMEARGGQKVRYR